MRPVKVNRRTMPKRKPATPVKAAAKKGKVKVKAKFNLKGIPAKYKQICSIAIEHADTQLQCDELVLVGVNAFETLLETYTIEHAEKLKMDIVTKAILFKKETYLPII